MKKIYLLSLLALCLFSWSACHRKTSSTGMRPTDTTDIPLAVEEGPGKDDPRVLNSTMNYSGHQYDIEVKCVPDDSLPKLKDRFGDPYLDNRVTVTLKRDGHILGRQSLTKAAFVHLLGENKEKLMLGGMAFSAVDAHGFHFGAQLNIPGDEEGGLAFKVTLPLNGQARLNIERDTEQDTSSSENAD